MRQAILKWEAKFWYIGDVSANGKGSLQIFEKGFDAEKYKDILSNKLEELEVDIKVKSNVRNW